MNLVCVIEWGHIPLFLYKMKIYVRNRSERIFLKYLLSYTVKKKNENNQSC